jgi:acyl-CoA synthetase (AMP-forming)/AMP-acid ligase II
MIDFSPGNIAAHLPAMAEKQPDTLAVVCPQRRYQLGGENSAHFTFRQLNEESDWIASGLEAIGIGPGVRTVLMVKPGLEFFALTFALFKVGAVPVIVDPGMGLTNLSQCLNEAEPEAFVGIPKAQAARILMRWGRRTIRTLVTVGPRLGWGGYTLKQVRKIGRCRAGRGSPDPAPSPDRRSPPRLRRPTVLSSAGSGDPRTAPNPRTALTAGTGAQQTAAILFTSGSTGPPKGAVYTHAIFAAQVEILRRTYGIEPGETDLPTFPLFALFAPALGMTAVIPDMDFARPAQVDPRKIIEAIDQFGVTNIFGSPALIDRVGRYGAEHKVKLPSLRRVISAGAPVRPEVVERFTRLLAPGVQVFTPYGATEALPISSIGSDEILKETRFKTATGAGVCVGRPVPEVKVMIIRISDSPVPIWSDDLAVPVGEIGEIVVQGKVVTKEYFNRPDATALAKIAVRGAERGENFYHRMGDLGYVDDIARLWFCGRKSQRVVTPNATLFTLPCEAVFNAHPHVRRTALVGVERNGSTRPVLCVEVEKNSRPLDLEKLKRELLLLGASRPHTRGIQDILFHPAFPVDIRHNAKIFREKLALWAARKLS